MTTCKMQVADVALLHFACSIVHSEEGCYGKRYSCNRAGRARLYAAGYDRRSGDSVAVSRAETYRPGVLCARLDQHLKERTGRLAAQPGELRGGQCPGSGHLGRSRLVAQGVRRAARRAKLPTIGRLLPTWRCHAALWPVAAR